MEDLFNAQKMEKWSLANGIKGESDPLRGLHSITLRMKLGGGGVTKFPLSLISLHFILFFPLHCTELRACDFFPSLGAKDLMLIFLVTLSSSSSCYYRCYYQEM